MVASFRKWMRFFVSVTISILAFSGIVDNYDGTWKMFMYYTYLSNALVAAVYALQIVFCLFELAGRCTPRLSGLKGVTTIVILFTLLTVLFVLNPFGLPKDWLDARNHYLVPLLVLMEWVFLEDHGALRAWYPALWSSVPAAYFGYVCILVKNGMRFAGGARFPYFFMNWPVYGWPMVISMLYALMIIFLLAGYGMLGLDRWFYRHRTDCKANDRKPDRCGKSILSAVNGLFVAAILLMNFFQIASGSYFLTRLFLVAKNAGAIKYACSVGFALLGLINLAYAWNAKLPDMRFYFCMTVGLVLAMLGDIVIMVSFAAGAGLFAVGHIFFTLAFCAKIKLKGVDALFAGLIFLFTVVFLILFVLPGNQPPMIKIICFVYAAVISMMCGKAIGNVMQKPTATSAIIAIGSALFVVSDCMLVLDYFVGKWSWAGPACMASYFPAVCLLAVSMYRKAIQDSSADKPASQQLLENGEKAVQNKQAGQHINRFV